jgi:hypothetical protein
MVILFIYIFFFPLLVCAVTLVPFIFFAFHDWCLSGLDAFGGIFYGDQTVEICPMFDVKDF